MGGVGNRHGQAKRVELVDVEHAVTRFPLVWWSKPCFLRLHWQRSWVARRCRGLAGMNRYAGRWWHHGPHDLRRCGFWRKRHHAVDRRMLKELRREGILLVAALWHGKGTGCVVARIVLPRDQVVPIHAVRDQGVIVITSACFTRLGRWAPIPSAPSSRSVTISK